MPKRLDLSGKRFGRLVVQREWTVYGKLKWQCLCDCGNTHYAISAELTSGHVKSCGCYRQDVKSLAAGRAAFNVLCRNYKRHAKERNLAFMLTEQEFETLTKQCCKYCGAPPSQIALSRSEPYLYNGVDRVNNEIGYVPTNVVPCCGICNRAKRDLTLEQFLAWAQRLLRHNDAAAMAAVH